MKRRTAIAALGMLLAGAVCGAAQEDRGYWRAASTTAISITGDVSIGDAKVTINFATFPLAPIRRLKPVEVSSVFDADVNAGIEGSLYRLKVPGGKYFLRHNTLCGDQDTQWMVTYAKGKLLQVAFFSGDDTPVFTFDAVQKSTALCGTYTYAR